MNMTRKRSRPMLKRAGSDTARENNNVRMPFADFTRRRIRPTRNTRTTLNRVGETRRFAISLDIAMPTAAKQLKVSVVWEAAIQNQGCQNNFKNKVFRF